MQQHASHHSHAASNQRLRDVMTRDPAFVRNGDTIQHAAKLMADLNVGALPVCENGHLEGMITDRDISVRCVAAGKGPDSKVGDAMSEGAHWCREDDSVEEACDTMCSEQIRRLPVVDSQKKLVGMVSMGDIATKASDDATCGKIISEVSTPSEPNR
ncbi:CBS domain-containing protein [Pandoraea vervacti]|uniref:CBS domain-containing protein n=2 Tax=Pandoraea vervacti TaxID=656178 RepID=A0ABM5T4A7_9BURK|nr:CBS domain-containing protein [Pandoraea vervacti]